MNYKQFATDLEHLQVAEDTRTGRIYNQDSFGHWVRNLSRRLTYVFALMGLHGPHILYLHFVIDAVALYQVYTLHPILAGLYWFIAHILDNCDGDLARYRGEADPKWGELDVALHTWGNIVFWIVLAVITLNWQYVTVILGLRVIMEHFRGKRTNANRYGEKNQFMKWVTMPTNVNIMYLAYVPFALSGHIEYYLYGYLAYYLLAAVGQSVVLLRKVAR